MPWAPLGMQRLRQAQRGVSSSYDSWQGPMPLCIPDALLQVRGGGEIQTSLIRTCSTSKCPREGSTCSTSPRTFRLTLGVGQYPSELG